MDTKKIIFVLTLSLSFSANADIFTTDEKCRVIEPSFTMRTYLKSIARDGLSENKSHSTLRVNGDKPIVLKPESMLDSTPMLIGAKYTFVGGKKRVTMNVRNARERSSRVLKPGGACAPVLSVKEYDVSLRGVTDKTIQAKMICDNRTSFVSEKCR